MQVLYWEINIFSTPLVRIRQSKKTVKDIDKIFTNPYDGVGGKMFIGFRDKIVFTA